MARPKQVVIPGKGEEGEASAEVRKRVIAARGIQLDRQGVANERLDTAGVRDHCRLTAADETFLESAAEQLRLSPRGCQRVLKVARTIADLDGEAEIGQAQLAEAIGYRQPADERALQFRGSAP